MRVSFILALLCLGAALVSGCATTTAPTESTTETFDKTTNAALDVTSSTSPGSRNSSAQATEFARTHYASVQRDMAVGQGEYLEALGELLGVPAVRLPAFCALGRESYPQLYKRGEQDPARLVAYLEQSLQQRPELLN